MLFFVGLNGERISQQDLQSFLNLLFSKAVRWLNFERSAL